MDSFPEGVEAIPSLRSERSIAAGYPVHSGIVRLGGLDVPPDGDDSLGQPEAKPSPGVTRVAVSLDLWFDTTDSVVLNGKRKAER